MTRPLQPGDKGKIAVEIGSVGAERHAWVKLPSGEMVWIDEAHITDHEPRAIGVGDWAVYVPGGQTVQVKAIDEGWAWVMQSCGHRFTTALSALTRVQDPAK